MTAITVDTSARTLKIDGRVMPCAIGRSGACAAEAKREGDGRTPLGRWQIRAALLRTDRVAAPAGLSLPWRRLRPGDGWSDDPADPAYNRPVIHPHDFSAEKMWREDGLYDAVLIIGHNDDPPAAGAGSAIFMHCWDNGAATEGCVAIERKQLLDLLTELAPRDEVEIF